MSAHRWEEIRERGDPAWYLDPLVARQKHDLNLSCVRAWAGPRAPAQVLKTDTFEESHGKDSLLGDLFPEARMAVGMDVAWSTVHAARERTARPSAAWVTCDVRALPFGNASLDLIVSNSTLDHFPSQRDFGAAVAELARVLRPGGRLILSLDNRANLLYRLLSLVCRTPWAPFPLGYTTDRTGLAEALQKAGLRVLAETRMIHNPRLLSTLLFLGLRAILGRWADGPIRLLLASFAQLERLPTRNFTACFIAACAEKPASPGG